MLPTVYMLCGLPASGKSTYAHKLAKTGFVKLSPDEEVYKRFERAGADYPAQEYLKYYNIVLAELEREMLKLLEQKSSCILDYGYWKRAHREKHKNKRPHNLEAFLSVIISWLGVSLSTGTPWPRISSSSDGNWKNLDLSILRTRF